ncbi:MAG: hypothetical protein H0V46_01420 [Sphingomonas sp.]|nr:hypothetical protein [Sphingomonas sp.]
MKMFFLLGAAAMLSAAPALADKPGKSQGSKAHATKHAGHKASAKVDRKAKAVTRTPRDRNGNRIDDRDEALARKYGGALCPPGLAKKSPACVPPGQAKRMFREGQRLSSNYRYYTPYNDIPLSLRDRYDLDDDNRYIYRNNVIYSVDPRSRLITDIINAIL